MSPLLDSSFEISEETQYPDQGEKYVRVGEEIAVADDGFQSHAAITSKYFSGLRDQVDDGGFVSRYQGKLHFSGRPPITIRLKNGYPSPKFNSARAKTREVAISILGAERVG